MNEPELVHRVFDHWVKATRRSPNRTQLTDERKRLIATRLRTYPIDDLIAAIDGCANDDWHQGANDRGTKYDDLALILRDAAHIEKFRDANTAQVDEPKVDTGFGDPDAPPRTADWFLKYREQASAAD